MQDPNLEVLDSDISLNTEEGTATWNLTFQGRMGGTYMGTFKFRCSLTPTQYLDADRDFRDLLGKNAELAGTHAEDVAYSLAQLRQRVMEAPPFWNDGGRYGGGGVKDHDVLSKVLNAAIASELKLRKELEERHEKAINQLKEFLESKKKKEAALVEGANKE